MTPVPPFDPGEQYPASPPPHPAGTPAEPAAVGPKAARRKPAPKDQGFVHSFRAFRHRDYRIFWFGALASNTGTWLSNLTVPYILFTLTGSAVWVAYATLAQLGPAVLLGALGGHMADRFNRRRVLLGHPDRPRRRDLCPLGRVGVRMAQPVHAAGVRGPDRRPQRHQHALLAVFVNDLVPREDLLSAVTLNSMQFNAARAIGPAIAGVLLATLGPSWAFFLNFLSFGFVLAALLCVASTQPPVSGRHPARWSASSSKRAGTS